MSGPAEIVQIDQLLHHSKRKYNRGRFRNGDITPNVYKNVSIVFNDIDDYLTQRNSGILDWWFLKIEN